MSDYLSKKKKKMLQNVYTVQYVEFRCWPYCPFPIFILLFLSPFFQVLLCKKYFAVNIELFYKHIFMVSFFGSCSGGI